MTPLRHLLLLEARAFLRDRTFLWLALACVVLGAATPWALPRLQSWGEQTVGETLERRPSSSVSNAPGAGQGACDSASLPALEVVGELPTWLDWPGVGEPSVPLEVRTPSNGLVELQTDGGVGGALVHACLKALVDRERTSRREALGIDPWPDPLVSVSRRRLEPVDPEAPGDADDVMALLDDLSVSWLGISMALLGWLVAGSGAIEAVPRRRSTGFLELLRSTQTHASTLVWAWTLATGSLGVATVAVTLLAYGAVAAALGSLPGLGPSMHALPLALLTAALSLRTSLRATTVQAATMRWMLVLVLTVAGTALSAWWVELPWFAALVPLGGSLLASAGLLGGWALLADLAAVVWTVLVVGWCGWLLQREEAASGLDPVVERRAAGNYRPEALTLTAVGAMVGVYGGAAPFAEHPLVGLVVSFAVCFGLPIVLAPSVLNLSWGELYPFRRPRPLDVALTVPVVVGLIPLAYLIITATLWVLPMNQLFVLFSESMDSMVQSPVAKVAIGVLPGIFEELFYRGLVFALLLRGHRPAVANVGQAAAFALAHGMAFRLPWTFVFGLLMGSVRLRTGSMWPSMLIHTALNITFAVVGTSEEPSSWVLLGLVGLLVLPLYGRRRGT